MRAVLTVFWYAGRVLKNGVASCHPKPERTEPSRPEILLECIVWLCKPDLKSYWNALSGCVSQIESWCHFCYPKLPVQTNNMLHFGAEPSGGASKSSKPERAEPSRSKQPFWQVDSFWGMLAEIWKMLLLLVVLNLKKACCIKTCSCGNASYLQRGDSGRCHNKAS